MHYGRYADPYPFDPAIINPRVLDGNLDLMYDPIKKPLTSRFGLGFLLIKSKGLSSKVGYTNPQVDGSYINAHHKPRVWIQLEQDRFPASG